MSLSLSSKEVKILILKVKIKNSLTIKIEIPFSGKKNNYSLQKFADDFVRGLSVSEFSLVDIVDVLTLQEYEKWVFFRDYVKEDDEGKKT